MYVMTEVNGLTMNGTTKTEAKTSKTEAETPSNGKSSTSKKSAEVTVVCLMKVIASSENLSKEINCPLSMRVSFEEIDSILNCSSVSVSLIMFRSRKCT